MVYKKIKFGTIIKGFSAEPKPEAIILFLRHFIGIHYEFFYSALESKSFFLVLKYTQPTLECFIFMALSVFLTKQKNGVHSFNSLRSQAIQCNIIYILYVTSHSFFGILVATVVGKTTNYANKLLFNKFSFLANRRHLIWSCLSDVMGLYLFSEPMCELIKTV